MQIYRLLFANIEVQMVTDVTEVLWPNAWKWAWASGLSQCFQDYYYSFSLDVCHNNSEAVI